MRHLDTIHSMSPAYRALHGLLATAGDILCRASDLAKDRSLEPAVIAEITASMALANAARAMTIAIHETRSLTGGSSSDLGLERPTGRLSTPEPA